MKNRVLSALFALALVPGCALLRQGKIEKPKVKVESIDVRDMTLTHADLVFGLSIVNPNKFELKVDEVDYALKVGGKDVGQGKLTDVPGVPAEGSGLVHIPVKVNLAGLIGSLAGLVAEKVTGYELKGEARFGVLSLPFDEEGHLTYRDGKIQKLKK